MGAHTKKNPNQNEQKMSKGKKKQKQNNMIEGKPLFRI